MNINQMFQRGTMSRATVKGILIMEKKILYRVMQVLCVNMKYFNVKRVFLHVFDVLSQSDAQY